MEQHVDDRRQPEHQEQPERQQDRGSPPARRGARPTHVEHHEQQRKRDGCTHRRGEADVGLHDDCRGDREGDDLTERAGGDEPREEQHEDEPDQRDVRIPGLSDRPRPDAEVGHADDRGCRQHHAQPGPAGDPGEPPHRHELDDGTADVSGPCRLSRDARDRGDEPEHGGAGMAPSRPAPGPGQRWVGGPDVADPQIDDREVVDGMPRAAGEHDDGDDRRRHDRRGDEPAERKRPSVDGAHGFAARAEGSRGRPSVRSPTTLRWISFVPAQMELAW